MGPSLQVVRAAIGRGTFTVQPLNRRLSSLSYGLERLSFVCDLGRSIQFVLERF